MESTKVNPGSKRPGGFLFRLFAGLSIEPAFLIISFSYHMEKLVMDQLITYKICKNDFDFSTNICTNLDNANFTEQNTLVTKEVRIKLV